MTDKEKRAHDLAIMYTHYSLDCERSDTDSFIGQSFEMDVCDAYEASYATFLSLLDD